jgi:outer membrane lipoprotein-sorting protein
MRPLSWFAGVLILLGLLTSSCQPPPPTSAQEVLDRMKQAYAACNTYQDEGETVVIMSLRPGQGVPGNMPIFTNSTPFRIQFKRPSLLYYESVHFVEPSPVTPDDIRNMANWSQNKWGYYQNAQSACYYSETTHRYWRGTNLARDWMLTSMFFQGAHSPVISFLTSSNTSLSALGQLAPTMREDVFDGSACYVVSTILKTNMITQETWIGKQDFLLRKNRMILIQRGTQVVDENHRNIRINRPIADNVFTPPLAPDAQETTNVLSLFPDEEKKFNGMMQRNAATNQTTTTAPLSPPQKVINLAGVWSGSSTLANAKEPRYIDCYPDKVILYPGTITNTWADLQQPDNAIDKLLSTFDSKSQYVVIMARPQSVKFFRAVRQMVRLHQNIDVSYDAVAADFRVNWDESQHALEQAPTAQPPATPIPMPSASGESRGFRPTDQNQVSQPSGEAGIFRPKPRMNVVNKQPLFFECRNGEVFFIDKAGLDDQVTKLLASISPEAKSGDLRQFLKAVSSQPIVNEYYKVVPSYLLTMIMALEPKPGVHGDNGVQVTTADRPFQKTLDKYDKANYYTVFLVRDDSFDVFHTARLAAFHNGFEIGWELLGVDEPIKFGTGGSSIQTR